MSIKTGDDVFRSVSQRLDHVDPTKIRLIGDRVLILDIPDSAEIGGIIVPEIARGAQGGYRWGLVVAVGPGDRFIEMGVTSENEVIRKAIKQRTGTAEYLIICAPTECWPGDLVLYDRRREAEFILNGNERYSLVHAEQSVIAIDMDYRRRGLGRSRGMTAELVERILLMRRGA